MRKKRYNLIIDSCFSCPSCWEPPTGPWRCNYKGQDKKLEEPLEIPDWCPFEDAAVEEKVT